MPTRDPDSDSDVEFEDILPQSNQSNSNQNGTPAHQTWTPTLILPSQRPTPVTPGSEDETQLRGRLTTGLERITYRQMKADMGMDAPGTPHTDRRYENFKELADDIEGMIDMLWVSATRKSAIPIHQFTRPYQPPSNEHEASIQVEGLITLAGILEMALKSYPFDPESILGILHKFDCVFEALCTGVHPLTNEPIPGARDRWQTVTQTQKVRIRSLAEMTRNKLFSMLPDYEDEDVEQPWLIEVTRVYDRTLMLLADEGGVGGAEWNWR